MFIHWMTIVGLCNKPPMLPWWLDGVTKSETKKQKQREKHQVIRRSVLLSSATSYPYDTDFSAILFLKTKCRSKTSTAWTESAKQACKYHYQHVCSDTQAHRSSECRWDSTRLWFLINLCTVLLNWFKCNCSSFPGVSIYNLKPTTCVLLLLWKDSETEQTSCGCWHWSSDLRNQLVMTFNNSCQVPTLLVYLIFFTFYFAQAILHHCHFEKMCSGKSTLQLKIFPSSLPVMAENIWEHLTYWEFGRIKLFFVFHTIIFNIFTHKLYRWKSREPESGTTFRPDPGYNKDRHLPATMLQKAAKVSSYCMSVQSICLICNRKQ